MAGFRYRSPVLDEELDHLGNWHSYYFFRAFIETRVALFESFGVTPEDIKKAGFAIVASELHSKYRKSLLKGDIALIEIDLVELQESKIIFLYKVRKEGDFSLKIYSEGLTVVALIDTEKRVKASLPAWIREPLVKMDKAPWPEWMKKTK